MDSIKIARSRTITHDLITQRQKFVTKAISYVVFLGRDKQMGRYTHIRRYTRKHTFDSPVIKKRGQTWLNKCFSESIESLIILNILESKNKIQMIHMTDDNEEAKYLSSVERIHSCHNISKKKKYSKKSTFCKSNRKEFKKFGPEKIKITSVNYRSKKLNSPRLGSRSKVQGRFLRELTQGSPLESWNGLRGGVPVFFSWVNRAKISPRGHLQA